jgi:hypothetical protein
VRILHVSEVAIGGVAALLRRFAEEQARRGHDVQVLAPPTLSAEVPRAGWELQRRRP